ncbi:major facilitator superfamily domain-containing protein [Xylaria scruposa]|nr:major facilitator superfamily domain-containing protein [Xylaria scruposa]
MDMKAADELRSPHLTECGDPESAYFVTWEGPADYGNPRNWSAARKWRNVILVSLQALLPPMASVILTTASMTVAQDFGVAQGDAYTPTLPTALFVLGFGFGPLYLAPLSEIYGRRIIFLVCFALFTILNAACAVAPNMASLSVFRFLCGMVGSAGPSIGGGTMGDMFEPGKRGKAQSVYTFGPTGGSAIGGVIGGFILNGTGNWRWLPGVMAIAGGVVSFLSFFFLQETFAPVLLRQKAARRRLSTGDQRYHSEFDFKSAAGRLTYRHILNTITRAVRMLFTSSITAVMAVYLAVIYGILYLHLVTLPLLFSPEPIYGLPSYRWPSELTGLSYLGTGVGSILGSALGAIFLNRSYLAMTIRAAGKGFDDTNPDPRRLEYRMPFMQIGAALVPAGLLIFAFTAREDIPWIAPLIGATIFSVGMLMTYICVTTYLVDVFENFSASALAAITLTRSLLAFAFAFIGNGLYRSLGYQWGTLLLAFLCIVLCPLPAVFYFFGPKIRSMGSFQV